MRTASKVALVLMRVTVAMLALTVAKNKMNKKAASKTGTESPSVVAHSRRQRRQKQKSLTVTLHPLPHLLRHTSASRWGCHTHALNPTHRHQHCRQQRTKTTFPTVFSSLWISCTPCYFQLKSPCPSFPLCVCRSLSHTFQTVCLSLACYITKPSSTSPSTPTPPPSVYILAYANHKLP